MRCYLKRYEVERSKYQQWERISSYGQVYQYGRSGRTLAPSDIISAKHGYFNTSEYAALEGRSNAALTELILTVESFNQYVKQWNASLPEMWDEYKSENNLQSEIDAHNGKVLRRRIVETWE